MEWPFDSFRFAELAQGKRRGRDSNPGTGFPVNCLAGSCLQPLGHLSTALLLYTYVSRRINPRMRPKGSGPAEAQVPSVIRPSSITGTTGTESTAAHSDRSEPKPISIR
jgi:hypothetical protein